MLLAKNYTRLHMPDDALRHANACFDMLQRNATEKDGNWVVEYI